ncbi:hypothetical protein GJ496_003560 [Pomphorhynchus laevis]|nr:hypothetical protein GJ496_003560 [Pomphorhynchus laevis]
MNDLRLATIPKSIKYDTTQRFTSNNTMTNRNVNGYSHNGNTSSGIQYYKGSTGETVMVSSQPLPPYNQKRRQPKVRVQYIRIPTPEPTHRTVRRRLKTPIRKVKVVNRFNN